MRSEHEQTTTESLTPLQHAQRDENPWSALSPALIERTIAGMPYPIAALDRRGVIVAVNDAWRRFARENGAPALAETSVGMDYLATCRSATGPFSAGAREAMQGIQSVLEGERPLFTLEYPCPSLEEQRWFLLHVTPLPVDHGGAIVSHIEIPRRRTEEERARALAIEAEARAKAEADARQLSQLQAVTDTALTHWELPALESALMERVQQVMAVDYVWLMLATEDGRELIMRATRGPELAHPEHLRIQVGQGLMGRIALNREPLVVDDLSAAEVAYPEFARRGGIRSFAGAPLFAAGRLVGALSIGSKQPRHFTPEDVDFLRLAGDRIALALERARLDEIAQRARAEAEARASQLAAVVEAISDPLIVFDRDGNILLQNAADRSLLGLASDAPRSRTLRERGEKLGLTDLQGQPLSMAQWPTMRILRGETIHGPHIIDVRFHGADGREVVASAGGAPIRDARGDIVGGVLIARDITERQRLARELEERLNQLAVIIESISDGLVVFDREGHILLQNAADRALMGLSPSAPAPRTLRARGEMLRLSDLEGQPMPMAQWAAVRVLRGEVLHGADVLDVMFHRADGSKAVVSLSGGPIRDANGTIIAGVLATRDITARRAMEQRTRDLLDALLAMAEALVSPAAPEVSAPGADLVTRRLAELTRNALGCERISIVALEPADLVMRAIVRLGWPPEEEQWWYRESTRYHLSALIPPSLIARLREGESVLINRAPPWSAASTADGAKLLVTPLRTGAQLIGALALDFGDTPHTYTAEEIAVAQAVGRLAALVLERDRLTREREEAIASEMASRQIQERMDEFIATATHDLRSPLAAGKLAVQVARRRIERLLSAAVSGEGEDAAARTAAIRSNLEVIEGSMNRLSRLVDRLMDVSRVRAGKLRLELEPHDLRPIVRRAVEEQHLLEPNRPLRVRLPSRPVTVLIDADRASQVITNLLTNALRYAPGDSPIDITLRITGRQARLSVRDRGPGIRREEQADIWERFNQAERGKSTAAKSGGLGLGLYISREIIRLHGGQIGVRSAPGQGSTFWFTLPLVAGAESPDDAETTAPTE
jgi:PAS domain S-box-containing protein